MAVVTLVISILALLCGLFALVFKRVGPQGPKGNDGVSIIKDMGDLTAEDIVRLLSTLEVINFGKGTVIKCDGYYDVN